MKLVYALLTGAAAFNVQPAARARHAPLAAEPDAKSVLAGWGVALVGGVAGDVALGAAGRAELLARVRR